MVKSPLVLLDTDKHQRILNIYNEYISTPQQMGLDLDELLQHFENALSRIENRLGGATYKSILTQLRRAFKNKRTRQSHYEWIEALLAAYYDKLYTFAFKRHPRRVVFKGDYQACREYLSNIFPLKRTMMT